EGRGVRSDRESDRGGLWPPLGEWACSYSAPRVGGSSSTSVARAAGLIPAATLSLGPRTAGVEDIRQISTRGKRAGPQSGPMRENPEGCLSYLRPPRFMGTGRRVATLVLLRHGQSTWNLEN